MYYATAQTFVSLIQRKKKSRNFFESQKLFFARIAMHKSVWLKKKLYQLNKLFSGCTKNFGFCKKIPQTLL